MRLVTPAERDLARRIWAYEARAAASPEARLPAAARAFEKLRLPLIKLFGVTGFQILFVRALSLAQTEAAFARDVRVQADGSLDGFLKVASTQKRQEAEEAGIALLAQLLGLLVTFLGETLTLHLLQTIWPPRHRGSDIPSKPPAVGLLAALR